MIISRTPMRVSLVGGGTDYPAYYREHGGAVIGFALDRYAYLTVRKLPPFFPHYRHRLVYSNIELVKSAAEIQHPTARVILQQFEAQHGEGWEIHHDGDLPARSGLGSSSSFTVGLLSAMHALYGSSLSISELAHQATEIEQSVEAVGAQDQVFAAYGGFNRIDFPVADALCNDPEVIPLDMPPDDQRRLLDGLLLVYTGVSRYAAAIAAEQVSAIPNNFSFLRYLYDLVDEVEALLREPGDSLLPNLGALLEEAWTIKRQLAPGVTTQLVDDIYEAARANGALGGKLLGAGGGGFLLLVVPPERRDALKVTLRQFVTVDPGVAATGSQIVLNEPNGFP
jgi:D-glycero-alpha-D-manno-heptose-7-phosphate kinase